jgi:hypoxanthine phosphoribosyltransferase
MADLLLLKDKQFKIFIPYSEITLRVKELAQQVNDDFAGKEPLFLAILNGSFMFAADLFKHLEMDCGISFVKVASYKGTTSTGNVVSLIGLEERLHGRHVIILEDIVDTGKTLAQLVPDLQNQGPASVSIITLLAKPTALQYPVKVDYVGFEIPEAFIVGYGLDYDGLGRNLKDIWQVV